VQKHPKGRLPVKNVKMQRQFEAESDKESPSKLEYKVREEDKHAIPIATGGPAPGVGARLVYY